MQGMQSGTTSRRSLWVRLTIIDMTLRAVANLLKTFEKGVMGLEPHLSDHSGYSMEKKLEEAKNGYRSPDRPLQ